jgi:hypothetical protein
MVTKSKYAIARIIAIVGFLYLISVIAFLINGAEKMLNMIMLQQFSKILK